MQLLRKKRNPSVEDFRTENWDILSERERLRSLQFYENSLAQEQGRSTRKVVWESDRKLGGAFGRYDIDSSKKIYINQAFLRNKDNSNSDWNSYNAMNTVAHEGRHAYQDDCIRGTASPDTCGISSAQLESWEINNKSYMGFDNDPVRFSEYRFQPMENDAFQYAHSKMEALCEVYKNDFYYQQSINYIRESNAREADNAEKFYGSDFQKVIENKVRDNYQAEHGYSENSVSSGLANEHSMERLFGEDKKEGHLFQNLSIEKENNVNEIGFQKIDKSDFKNRGHTDENMQSVEKKALQESTSFALHKENFRTDSNKSVGEKQWSNLSNENVSNSYTGAYDLARQGSADGVFYQGTSKSEESGDVVKRNTLKDKGASGKEGEKLSTGKGNEANRNLENLANSKDMWMGM